MATLKEVKTKISGVKKTAQITKAMNMVAAAKLRGAQEKMEDFQTLYGKIQRCDVQSFRRCKYQCIST